MYKNKIIGNIFGKIITQNDIDKIDFDKLPQKLKALKTKNNHISKVQGCYFSMVKKANKLEKNKMFDKAINEYNIALNYAYSEPVLKIHNYAHSIYRLIILYGKTKQKNKLKNHLVFSIDKNSSWKDVENWKKRLNKL